MFDPTAFQPPAEKPEVYGSDRHGLEQAANDLAKQRAKADAPVKKWRLGENSPAKLSTREVADRLTFSRKMQAARKLAEETGWEPEVAGTRCAGHGKH